MADKFTKPEMMLFDEVLESTETDLLKFYGGDGRLTCGPERIIFEIGEGRMETDSGFAEVVRMKKEFLIMAEELRSRGVDPKATLSMGGPK